MRFASWLEWMQNEAGVSDKQLTIKSGLRRHLAAYRNGERKVTVATAFAIGEALGNELPFISGVVGLFGAGYISETIRVLNENYSGVGPASALGILSALPLIVESEIAFTSAHASDIKTARAIATMVSKRHGTTISSWWDTNQGAKKFHVGSDFVNDAFRRAYRIALGLEAARHASIRDIWEASFPIILASERPYDRRLTDFESLYRALGEHEELRDMYEPLELNIDWIKESIELGGRLRWNVRYGERRVTAVDATPDGLLTRVANYVS